MAILIAFPFLGFLLIVQSAIMSQVVLLHGTADLVLLAIVAWTLQKRVRTAWQWGFIGGSLVTLVSGLPVGVALVGYLLAVGLALLLRQRIWRAPAIVMLVATLISSVCVHLLTLVALRITGTTLPLFQSLNLVTLPSVFLNLLLALPMYAIVGDIAKWIYPAPLEG